MKAILTNLPGHSDPILVPENDPEFGCFKNFSEISACDNVTVVSVCSTEKIIRIDNGLTGEVQFAKVEYPSGGGKFEVWFFL